MFAFVQNAGVNAAPSVLPRTGLQAVCGVSGHQPAHTTSRSPCNLRMSTPNYGITLQTLVYNPTPTVSGEEDKDLICYSVWKQVFGNAYVMESERADAYEAESMFRAGQIPLRDFVRAVALSATYRRRFFECCGPYRAVELNFKHLLGRGPNSQEEISEHVQRIANEGFEAEINSYIDSDEYDDAFGDDLVPYRRFKGTYPTIEEFNRMCAIYSFPGTTDKSLTRRARSLGIENPNRVLSLDGAGVPSRLAPIIAMGKHSSFVSIKKGIPSRPDLESGQSSRSTGFDTTVINEEAQPRKRIQIAPGSYMYLTSDEEQEFKVGTSVKDKVNSLAEEEIKEAKAKIAELQARIEELSQDI